MKKITLFLVIILIGCSSVFAQSSKAKKKLIVKTKSSKATTYQAKKKTTTLEREKFDPTANPSRDLQTAITKAQKQNKRIILDVGGEWCGWCHEMDKFLTRNVELNKLRAENFVWLKVNFSEENENKSFLANYPAITGYPHLFVLEKDGTFIYSKETSELEDGGKSYNLQRFTDFLNEYAPASNKNTDALFSVNNRRPDVTLDKALAIASAYVKQNDVDISDKYIDSVKLHADIQDKSKSFWMISWELNRFAKGGQIFVRVFMDKTVKINYGE